MRYYFTDFFNWEQPKIDQLRKEGKYIYSVIDDEGEHYSIRRWGICNRFAFLVTEVDIIPADEELITDEEFIALNLELEGPEDGRIAYVSKTFYKYLHLDEHFIKRGDMSQEMLVSGVMGEVDGVQIKPTKDLPANCDFVICHSVATTAAQKLRDLIIHDNPPGINGWLVEGRVRFTAFVRDNKKNAIGSHWDTQAHIPGTAGVPVTPPENIPNVVPSITLTKAATTVAVGGTETLVPVIEGAPADTAITWASSVEAKATVSNKGKITGVATGSTVVTATITVDEKSYVAACDVTVVSA